MDGVLEAAGRFPSWVGQVWPVIFPVITLLLGSYVADKQASDREERQDRMRRDQEIRDREIADLIALQKAVYGMSTGAFLIKGALIRMLVDRAKSGGVPSLPDVGNEPWHMAWREACSVVVIASHRAHDQELRQELVKLGGLSDNLLVDLDIENVQKREELILAQIGVVLERTSAMYRDFDRPPLGPQEPWYRLRKNTNPQISEKTNT